MKQPYFAITFFFIATSNQKGNSSTVKGMTNNINFAMYIAPVKFGIMIGINNGSEIHPIAMITSVPNVPYTIGRFIICTHLLMLLVRPYNSAKRGI